MPCDFCHAEAPGYWHFEVEGFMFVHTEGKKSLPVVVETGLWGACDLCAPLVLAKDVDGLISRFGGDQLSHGIVRDLHTRVLAHISKRTPTWSAKVSYEGEKHEGA